MTNGGRAAAWAAAIVACAQVCAAAGKIGFVDMEKVFERYQKTVDLKARLTQEGKERIAERKVMVEEINRLKDEADLLRDEAKRGKEAVIDEKVKALYGFEEKVKREALQKQARLQDEIIGEIRGAIAEVGSGDGYDALFTFTGDDVGYHAVRLDVTDKVLNLLNRKYGEGRR
ncbi:MAG: OmpH family outer membrane protein [bacterium]|nr:OmpH family outer membrane protein [bacterium]